MNTVNYLLLYEGNSNSGGYVSSVRGFIRLEAARSAMLKSYRRLAAAMGVPVGGKGPWNQYTIKGQDSLQLKKNCDWFQWKIVKAVPEDGDSAEVGESSWRGLTEYTVTIEEHIAQEFSISAYDIFHALESAEEKYKRGKLVVQPSTPNARLIMARDNETGEVTEWKEF